MSKKKGGGLMVLYKNNNFLIKKMETIHKDILVIQCQIYSFKLRMTLFTCRLPIMLAITNLYNMFKDTLKILRIISFCVILMDIHDSYDHNP